MLEMTLATNFIPGNNLKGNVAGAAWLFLLPNIDLQRVVCIGVPLPSTLNMLLRFSQEVALLVSDSQRLSELGQRDGLEKIVQISIAVDGILPMQDGAVDLILLTDSESIQQYIDNKQRRSELERILAANGYIYYEGRDYFYSRKKDPVIKQGDEETNLSARFWLTPLMGEMQTAVPLDDSKTIDYFLRQMLYSPMLNLSGFIATRAKHAAKSRSSNGNKAPAASTLPKKKSARRRLPLKQTLRTASLGMLGAVERVEEMVDRKRPVQRFGVIYGGPEVDLSSGPPHYLQSIAQQSGINLDGYGWGLSARGEYSSRKMLFFLFDPTQNSSSPKPNIIVKMVRDPGFNYRLENEAQSLKILQDNGLYEADVLPRVLFAGHHAGLSIVGECVIEGVPFRQKSEMTAGCPYVCEALNWFVDLGAATADSHAATPVEVGAGLSQLFKRFVEIYQPTAEQFDFLEEQIAKLSNSDTAIPLVFQHGDPGPWNMLVTPQGRVAVLDWEAAEAAGMPCWDLFYFMRSYSLDAARKNGINDRLEGFSQQFLNDTPISRLFVNTIARYCQLIGLDRRLVEPLFYTCWMHRSLKEAMRIEPEKLSHGHFVNLIWWCKEHLNSETLSRLFSLPAELSENVDLLRKL